MGVVLNGCDQVSTGICLLFIKFLVTPLHTRSMPCKNKYYLVWFMQQPDTKAVHY